MPKLPENFPFEKNDLVYKTRNFSTNPEWGWRPSERPIMELLNFGLINLDKPPNLTSHEVSAYIAKILGLRKVAHGGTLDPGVSGILPIALERATPLARVMLTSDKEYIIVIRLHEDVDENKLLETIKMFEGPIYQRPPLRSAVVRKTRIRHIYAIEFIEKLGRDILIRVHCQAGTYMRKLATDLGDTLGIGAHMVDLRRISSGIFTEDETLCTMQDIIDAWAIYKETGEEKFLRQIILPAEVAILHLPRIIINDGAVGAIAHGAQLYAPGIVAFSKDIERDSLVAILTIKGELVALAKSIVDTETLINMDKGQVTGETRVLIPRTLYPPMWKQSH